MNDPEDAEAVAWLFHPDRKKWVAAGFPTWPDAGPWIEAGFKATGAEAWSPTGVQPREAVQWCNLVREWDDAPTPLTMGWVVMLTIPYHRRLTPAQVRPWTKVLPRFEPYDIGWCETNGVTPDDVRALLDSDRDDVRAALAAVDRTDGNAVFECVRPFLTIRPPPPKPDSLHDKPAGRITHQGPDFF